MSNNQIAIHKHGEDGGLHIDATTGMITTPVDERPLWAEGYVSADMAEYTQWHESRLGNGAPEYIKAPQLLEASVLSWNGVDEEGDVVEIDASSETRSSLLAQALGIDTSSDNFEKTFDGQLASALVDHDYSVNPSTEASLAEVEGASFEEVEKKAAQG